MLCAGLLAPKWGAKSVLHATRSFLILQQHFLRTEFIVIVIDVMEPARGPTAVVESMMVQRPAHTQRRPFFYLLQYLNLKP